MTAASPVTAARQSAWPTCVTAAATPPSPPAARTVSAPLPALPPAPRGVRSCCACEMQAGTSVGACPPAARPPVVFCFPPVPPVPPAPRVPLGVPGRQTGRQAGGAEWNGAVGPMCHQNGGGSLGNVLCKNRFWTNYVFITVWRSQDPFPHSGSPRNLLGFIFASFSFLSSPGLPPQQSAVEDWPPPGSWPGGGSDHRAFGSSPPPGRGAASSRKGGVDFPRAACAGMGVLPIRSGQRGKVAPRPPPTLPSHRRLCKTWQGGGVVYVWFFAC